MNKSKEFKSRLNSLIEIKEMALEISMFNLKSYALCVFVLLSSKKINDSGINFVEYIKLSGIYFIVMFFINAIMIFYQLKNNPLIYLMKHSIVFVVGLDVVYLLFFQLMALFLSWNIGSYMIGTTIWTIVLFGICYLFKIKND